MAKELTVKLAYKPRPLQAYIHRNLKRFSVLILHRRAGKSVLCVHEILDQALRCDKHNPQYAFIGPTYGSVKRIIWDIMKEALQDMPGVETNESELKIEIYRPARKDKIKIILLGAENPSAIRGLYLDGVVLDEAAFMEPEIWTKVIRPALSDREGWAIFISTPQGLNWFHDLYQYALSDNNWFTFIAKASETGIVPQLELDAAKALMSDAEYAQEFEVSFAAALVGAYWGKEVEKLERTSRVTRVPHDSLLTTKVYLDLGMDDMTAMWFVQNHGGREIRIIKYIEESGMGLDHFAKIITETGWLVEEVVLPHDGAVRELGTGKSRLEIMKKLLRGIRVRVAPRHKVEDGINAARLLLAKCYFDKDNCEKGLKALKNYSRNWNSKNKTFEMRPKHDWASHGADAFRLLAMEINENGPTAADRASYPRFADSKFDVV